MKTYQNGDEWRRGLRVLIDCKDVFVKDVALSHPTRKELKL